MERLRVVEDGRIFEVEVLEPLVRSYLVRPRAAAQLPSSGAHCELLIDDTPPVPCTVQRMEGDALRLLRGFVRP